MKALAVLLLLAAPVLAHATDIHPGDSLATVEAAFGAPRSQMQLGDKLVLIYDRGRVELVDGKVISSDVVSTEAHSSSDVVVSTEAQAQPPAQQASDDDTQAAQRAAQFRAQHVAEGEALKAKKRIDPNFTSAPPADQLAFWQSFRLRYPEVACDDEFNHAQQQVTAAQQLAIQQQQLLAQQQAAEQATTAQQQQAALLQQQLLMQQQRARADGPTSSSNDGYTP
jgi:hypothetical protein